MRFTFFLSFILISNICTSQTNIFEKNYLTNGYSDIRGITNVFSGGYIITGLDKTGNDKTGDMYAMKITYFGEIEWFKKYGLPNEDGGNNIISLQDGNYLISGHTNNFGTECDAYLKKIDPNGNEIWSKVIGEPADDEVAFSSIQDSDGNIYMVGRTSGNGSEKLDFFLCKLSNDGEIIYKKHFGTPNNEIAFNCIITSDNNILLVGYSTKELDYINDDIYVVKCSKEGNLLWSKTIQNNGDDLLKCSIEKNNNYYFFGHKNMPDLGIQAYILCCDVNGNTLWENTYGGEGIDNINWANLSSSNNFICYGETNSFGDTTGDIYKIVVDENGKLIEMNLFGKNSINEKCSIALLLADGSSIIVGSSKQKNENTNAYLVKTNFPSSLFNIINSENNVTTYPNPFTDEIFFYFGKNMNAKKITFYNINGQIIYSKEISPNTNSLIINSKKIGKGEIFYKIYDQINDKETKGSIISE